MLNNYVTSITRPLILTLLAGFFTSSISYAACESSDSPADQSLVFAIDISTSIEADEAELQLRAYENTLRDRNIQDKILGCGCTEVSVILFASTAQTVVQPTRLVTDTDIHTVLNFFSETINTQYSGRYLSEHFGLQGGTSVLHGLQASMDLLRSENNTAFRRAILISGDGANNTFAERDFVQIRTESEYEGIEINGVAINSDDGLCAAYEDMGELIVPGMSDACSRTPVLSLNGVRSFEQTAPRGREYDSVASFYEEFVANRFGVVNTADTFEDLAETLRGAVEAFACKPMM